MRDRDLTRSDYAWFAGLGAVTGTVLGQLIFHGLLWLVRHL